MGNSGDRRFVAVLEKLTADEDCVVAEHARWARKKLLAVDERPGSGRETVRTV
jgi:hypothetical protein